MRFLRDGAGRELTALRGAAVGVAGVPGMPGVPGGRRSEPVGPGAAPSVRCGSVDAASGVIAVDLDFDFVRHAKVARLAKEVGRDIGVC